MLNARITFENVNGCRTAEGASPGGAQSDAGKGWEDEGIPLFYIPVPGMHRGERS